MRVDELIKVLSEYAPDVEVLFAYDDDYYTPTPRMEMADNTGDQYPEFCSTVGGGKALEIRGTL